MRIFAYKYYFLFLISIFSQFSCNNPNCQQLPTKFSSYYEAVKIVRETNFKLEESVNTEKSSWIKKASYYSCDGHSGFFILETGGKSYIHSGMPIEIWKDFKNAESLGSYYDKNIKHKYLLKLIN